MVASYLCISLLYLLAFTVSVQSQSSPEVAAMQDLKASLVTPKDLNWSDPDPCQWSNIQCSNNGQVIYIELQNHNLKGTLPPSLKNLSSLTILFLHDNQVTGPIPSLAGSRNLSVVTFDNNSFTYMPPDFFSGLTALEYFSLNSNPISSWEIPENLKDAKCLKFFSTYEANISGSIPDFFGSDTFPELRYLNLAKNNLQGRIPSSFSKSSIQTLFLNSQRSNTKLNGSLSVIQYMNYLIQLWLDDNLFTGPLPDFSKLIILEELRLGDNKLTGIVSVSSFNNHPKLTIVNLSNNLLQGPTPRFNNSKLAMEMRIGSNSFCLDDPDVACDSRVNILLSIVESMGYPIVFAENWKGNDPCDTSEDWKGITCDVGGNITAINFQNLGLVGTISSNFRMLTSLKSLNLSNNALTGNIPNELTTLSNLKTLDVSNNHLHGRVPMFRENVSIIIDGNPDIGKYSSTPAPPPSIDNGEKTSNTKIILSSVIGVVCGVIIIVLGVCLYIKKPNLSRKIPFQVCSHTICGPSGIHSLEFGNMVIPIRVLRNATNNFREENKLGRGGFGTVYKGELKDGTKIAAKRMELGVVNGEGIIQFESEIAVLRKVRHRHLVAFLGYCLDGNERLLVYEYMPQGTLSRHLFNWEKEGLKPLEWKRRLNIALDVARGVEYLHGLAHQSFIHRDLKPSNILLGEDMQAKVADFGLVRLVPENGKHSFVTRVAGTFGYLAPEYVVTGRITAKVDVYSFGVILMELITGRKAVDVTHSDPDHVIHLVTWFRKMHINHDNFGMVIDKTIKLDEETLTSVSIVAELADRCCANEPCPRPDIRHVVNVLSSLVESGNPVKPDSDARHGVGLDTASASKPSSHSSTTPESLSPFATMHHSV